MELMMSVRSGTIFITISASSLARTQRSTTEVDGLGMARQHLLDLQLLDRCRQVVDGADDRHPHQRESVRALVVVDDGNREHAAAGVAQHATDHGGSGILAADDGHPDAHAAVRTLPAEKARMEPQEADPEEREGAPERDDLERHPGQVHLEPDGVRAPGARQG